MTFADDPGRKGAERRSHHRLNVQQRVRISASRDGDTWFTGAVSDCSEVGLGLLSPEPVEEGVLVVIEWRAGYFLGFVCNCRQQGNEWRLGIRLEEISAGKTLARELLQTAPAFQAIQLRTAKR